MFNSKRPPKKGERITSEFLREIARQKNAFSRNETVGSIAGVGSTRELFRVGTVKVTEAFQVSSSYSIGKAKRLIFSLNSGVDEVGVEVASENSVEVVDLNKSTHSVGDVLNVFWNAAIGKFQTLNVLEKIPDAQLVDKANNCGCADFVPDYLLDVEYGDYGPYSSVYYFIGSIPAPSGSTLGNQKVRLEHVADNIWESAEITLFQHTSFPDVEDITGIIEMSETDVTLFSDGYTEVSQPMAFIRFIPSVASEYYLYSNGITLPTGWGYRTLKPFNGSLNGNKLVYMPGTGGVDIALARGSCDACLAASRDLLPCEECNDYTRAFVSVGPMPEPPYDPENPYTTCVDNTQIPAGDYTLYSEVNSFFDEVIGWPLANAVCIFESEEIFAELVDGFHYKLVLIRYEETYEYADTVAYWKIGLLGYDTEEESPELSILTLELIGDSSCNMLNEQGTLIGQDEYGYPEVVCEQRVIVNYLDGEAV